MLLAATLAIVAPTLAPPHPWANGFAPRGRVPFAADLNGDGYGDLLCVSPKGDAFIDVALSSKGQKSMVPRRALSNWGKDASAVAFHLRQGKPVVYAIFGDTIRLASDLQGTDFKKNEQFVKLPRSFANPQLAVHGEVITVWSQKDGQALSFRLADQEDEPMRLSPGTQWVDAEGVRRAADGVVYLRDRRIGKMLFGNPVKIGAAIYVHEPVEGLALPLPNQERSDWSAADMDNDGDIDLVQFRYVSGHFGNNVVIHRTISPGETDSDADGIPNEQEKAIGSDPLNPDTDGDSLIDGWEIGEHNGLKLKELGASPTRSDVVCLISRFEQVDANFVKQQMDEVKKYYKSIQSPNPDGTKGWNLITIDLAPMNAEEQKRPWWENRDKFLPRKWKGMVHWMQLSPHGGGQADQLGDGGGCGGGGWALYATFIHEFGHQLGLPHEGFYGAAWCPTYPSLMNYAYSYTLEDSIRNVRYSDGRLADFKMRETDLSERIPLPYDKIKFLEKAPYRYRLKPDGENTLIDWNWNGVFGEEKVKADINYSYSTTAGHRDNAGKLHSAPWLFNHQGKAYALFARHSHPVDKKIDPSVSPERTGALILKPLITPTKWAPEVVVEKDGVSGDPVAVSFDGKLVAAYPTKEGVKVRWLAPDGKPISEPILIDKDPSKSPSIGVFDGRLLLTVYDPKTWITTYRWWEGKGFGRERQFGFLSTVPVGMAEDTIKKQLIVGLAWDQDKDRPSRWQIRRYSRTGETLFDRGKEWIEGEKGGSRGRSRPTILFDADPAWGPEGRIYYFALGMTSKESPWSCAYVSHTIGDKTVSGGWRTKRYYDEWTQSRSAPAAAWYGGDIVYAYRWVDGGQGDGDNILHVGYRGSGIEEQEMGDFDDISFIRDFGMRYSILYMLE